MPSPFPPTKYVVSVLQRKQHAGNPVIFGRTGELYPDGSYHPVMLASILINNQGIKSDKSGDYSLHVSPGKYNIAVRSIGYQPVLLKRLQISASDSIKIDFHLVADTVKL